MRYALCQSKSAKIHAVLYVSSFVCFASFVVKQFVTTKSTKVTKFGLLVMPRTPGYKNRLPPFASLRELFRLLSATDKFLFVVVSGQTKKEMSALVSVNLRLIILYLLCALCVSAVNLQVSIFSVYPERFAPCALRFVCVGLRLSNASPPNGAMFLFVVVSRQTKN